LFLFSLFSGVNNMSFRTKGLVLAIEDLDNEVVPEVLVPETQAQAEVAQAEVNEQVAEVEELSAAVEEAIDDAEALADVGEIMEEKVEDGEGLSPDAAAMAEVAVESIRARLGIRSAQRVVPAMESFGQSATRLQSTRIALEGITDVARRVWTAVKAAVLKVWEMIKSFFLGLVKNRKALLAHLEGLSKRVDDLQGTAKEAKLKTGAAKSFSVDGKADAGTASTVLESSEKLLTATVQAANAIRSTVGALASDDGNGVDDAVKSLGGKVEAAFAHAGKVKDGQYGHLVGGRSFVIQMSAENHSISLSVETNQKELAKEAAALQKSEMSNLLKQAIALVKNLQTFDKVEKELQDVQKAMAGLIDKVLTGGAAVVKKNEKEDKSGSEALNNMAAAVRSLNNAVAKFGTAVPGLAFNAAKAAGDYVTASINNYGTVAEDKKD
jgi:hypothetical protein